MNKTKKELREDFEHSILPLLLNRGITPGDAMNWFDQALQAKEEEVLGRVTKAFYEEIDEPYTKERMVSLPERFAKRLFSLKKGETK